MNPNDLALLYGGTAANFFGSPGDVIQYAQQPAAFSASDFLSGVPGIAAPVDLSASGGGYTAPAYAAPTPTSGGFTFTPPPLVLGGQTIPTAIAFDLPLAGSNVDQAAQAYAFTANNIANAYNFEANAQQSVLAFDQPFFTDVARALGQIGTGEAQALQTAASRIPKSSGGLFGGLFG